MDYRYGSHTVFKIEYHFVFVTKYRYQVLQGDVGYKARDLIKQTCDMHEIEIKKGSVSPDHVHIFVSAPPNIAPSEIMRRIEGRSSRKLFEVYPELRKRLGKTLLGKRVFLCNFGRGDRRDDQELY